MADIEQDFETFGAPPAEYLQGVQQAEEFDLWPENEEPLRVFLRLRTQWRVGMGGPVGLDYAGVRAALVMMRARSTPELFEDLQTMEAAALAAMNDGSERRR